MPTYVAVDLGATSGRVVNVRIDRVGFELDVVRRFPTVAIGGPDGDLTWDFDALLNDVTAGLADAASSAAGRSPLPSTRGRSTTACSTAEGGVSAPYTRTVRRARTA